jgi:transposase
MKKTRRNKKDKRARRVFTKEFKTEAAKLLQIGDRTAEEVGQSLGVSGSLIARWLREYQEGEEESFRGLGNRTSVEQELFEARRKIKQLEQERDILKKAAAYFARSLG